jgi:hypothetical protein
MKMILKVRLKDRAGAREVVVFVFIVIVVGGGGRNRRPEVLQTLGTFPNSHPDLKVSMLPRC